MIEGASTLPLKRTLSDDTGSTSLSPPSQASKPRSNSTDGAPRRFTALTTNLSFVSDPGAAAAAIGNDCKFGGSSSADRATRKQRRSERANHQRHSEIFDSVYRLKDDKYLEYEPMVSVSESDRARSVTVSAVMNVAPHVVLESTPLSVAYGLFTTVGLRHLVVLGGGEGSMDGTGKVVGIVTRKDLLEEALDERLDEKED